MSERYKFYDPDGLYFVTLTIVNWVPIFYKERILNIILESLKFCQKYKGLRIHCWCIMPNHVHLIISRSKPNYLLNEILRDFKKHTSREIIKVLNEVNNSKYLNIFRREALRIKRNKNFKVWKDGNHPILLDTNFLMDQKIDYIHFNPVSAGLCVSPEEYEWSSAKDYHSDHMGLPKLEFIS